MGSRSFVALGGTPSVNRLRLTEGVDWRPSEVTQEEHVDATLAGGLAEVMLTRDSPRPPNARVALTAAAAALMTGLVHRRSGTTPSATPMTRQP
jgi:hypothetical protein